MIDILLAVTDTPPDLPFRYLGLVDGEDFILPSELVTAVGLTTGVALETDNQWLHYVDFDLELYIAKQPCRSNVSWNVLSNLGVIFGGRTVEVNGKLYRVRVLTGANAEPGSAVGGEWNKYIYPVCDSRPEGPAFANFTWEQLTVPSTRGSYCQNSFVINRNLMAVRGDDSLVTALSWVDYTAASTTYGWRPVLELIN